MKDDVSKICLRGRPVPRSLARIWAEIDGGDDFLGAAVEVTLMTSLAPLDDGYGDAIAAESEDIAANVRAHRAVFARLGFFAEDGEGGFFAFDLDHPRTDDPPVVHLDSEGQYEWAGWTLGEALMHRAQDMSSEDAMRDWLRDLEIDATMRTIGVTTQFLPGLGALQTGLYHAERGEARTSPEPATMPASIDPTTWFLRPGNEVETVLCTLLGGSPDLQWVACDGRGLVNAVWVQRVPATEAMRVNGIGFGDDERSVETRLGPPKDRKKDWMRWSLGAALFRVGLTDGRVSEIGLFEPR